MLVINCSHIKIYYYMSRILYIFRVEFNPKDRRLSRYLILLKSQMS